MTDERQYALEEQVKVASPTEMVYLIKQAHEKGFNRQIKEEVIPELEGYSLIIPSLIHEFKAGKATTPHWRCRVLLRFGDDPNLPHEAWLDIDAEQFKMLRTVRQIHAEQAKEDLSIQRKSEGVSVKGS